MSDPTEQEIREYEERLQRRLRILVDESKAGKIRFTEDSKGVIDSLVKINYAPDGSFDLRTVDSSVRSLALGVEVWHDREELKNAIPLSEVQRAYFQILDDNLGRFYEAMVSKSMTPHQMASYLSKQEGVVTELAERLPDFLKLIKEFWDNTADAVRAHVEDMSGALRGAFGGDLFPSNEENIASKCAIYLDTIVLPDPFMRSRDLFEFWSPERQAYYLIKHSLNLLQYRDLACADVTPPIVIVLPGVADLADEEKQIFHEMGKRDSLLHSGRIFGRSFSTFEELTDFASSLSTVEKLVAKIADPSRVLFDKDFQGSLEEQIKFGLERHDTILNRHIQLNPAQVLLNQVIGRMSMCNELLGKARFLGGVPIMDAPTSWQYLVWKLEYDASDIEQEANVPNLHVVRGLQNLAENKMEWLGRVPTQALIELRKEGAIEEIRRILAKGISDISKAEVLNFQATTEEVFKNIENAFTEHRKSIYELEQKKWQFAGTTIASWIAKGSLLAAAAVASPLLLQVGLGIANTLLSPPKLKEIKEKNKNFTEEKTAAEKLPVGLLFKYSDG